MRRLWVRWALLACAVAVLATAFVRLGEWQLDRLHERRERNATTLRNEQAPVRSFAEVFTRPVTESDQWQRVSASGVFDAEHQFVVRYRSQGDRKGYEVVTPLRTDGGTVLVDRGFLALPGGTRIPSAAPPPPTGEVTVVGYVRRNEEGRGGAVHPVNGQVRLINSAALGTALPYPVADGYLAATTVDPPQAGGLEPVGLPEISEGPHFWYAVQWFMFAGLGLTGIVLFIRADLRARRESRRTGPAAQPVASRS